MISIILSVYNVEKFLEQCLNSIFNQTYRDFELIIINDGSTDSSINIIDNFRKKFSNIIYLEQSNRGLSEARNLGLSVAKGEYVLYVDSDDYIDLNMLELMLDKIKVDNSDMVIIGHTEFYDDLVGKDSDIFLEINDKQIYTGLQVANMMLDCKIMGVAWNKLYKRQKLIDEGFYFENGRYTQDWYPSFKHIAGLERISFINKPLYKYRLRLTSTTGKKNDKRLEDYNYAISSILNYVNNSNLNFDKNSINKFKVITINQMISLYYFINLNTGKNIYNDFKNKEYNQNNITIRTLFSIKGLDYRNILYLLAWKFRFYKLLLFVENNIRYVKKKFR